MVFLGMGGDGHTASLFPHTIALNETIEKFDGNIKASRLWNEQRLAYQINGQRKGTYWLTYFRMDPSRITELNRACRLNSNILRHLVVRHDERLADTLVAHALGESVSAEPPAAEPEKATEKAKESPQEAVASDGK